MRLRRTRVALVLAGASIALTACPATTTQSSGDGRTFVLYHDFDARAIVPIVDAFERHYRERTGKHLEVNTYHQPGGELRVALDLEASANRVKPDVVMMAHTELYALQRKHGMFRPLAVDGLRDPAIPPRFRNPLGDYAVANSAQPYLIAYNTARVTRDRAPKSWADLLDPMWSNQIGLGDPESTSGAHLPLWFLTSYLAGRVGAPFGWGFYERLSRLAPRTASSHDTISEFVNAGELKLGIIGLAVTVHSIRDGQPVMGVVPREGVPAFVHATAVTKASDDEAIGQLLVEWIVSRQGQQAIHDAYPAMPIRTDVTMANSGVSLSPHDVHPVDAAWIDAHRQANIERFRRVFGR